MTEMIEDGHRAEPGDGMPWLVMEHLRQLIPCDDVDFTEFSPQRREAVILQALGMAIVQFCGETPLPTSVKSSA
jgi:hypothetical protein